MPLNSDADVVWVGGAAFRLIALLYKVPIVVVEVTNVGKDEHSWNLGVDLYAPTLHADIGNGKGFVRYDNFISCYRQGPASARGEALAWWPEDVFTNDKTMVIVYNGYNHYWTTFFDLSAQPDSNITAALEAARNICTGTYNIDVKKVAYRD